MLRRYPLIAAASGLAIALTSLAVLRAASPIRVAAFKPGKQAPKAGPAAAGELIVEFRPTAAIRDAEFAIRDVGAVRARRISASSTRYWVKLDQGVPVEGALTQLRAMPEVDFAEPNGRVRAHFTPNDEFFRFQWNMQLVGAPRTWDIQRGDPSVVVAVLDTGIAYEDFGPFRKAPDWGGTRFVRGLNVFTGDEHANDDEGHGTHVASTIAEAANNGIGVAGLAFDCALMPVKVLDFEGFGSFAGVAQGIEFAAANGANVINMSLGGEGESEAVQRAVSTAVSRGVTVVASSGNDEAGPVSNPARLPNVIAVGAVGARKEVASFSNVGPELDVVAPGGNVCGDDLCDNDADGEPDGIAQQTLAFSAILLGRFDVFDYFYFAGTSQSAPHVSATAALLYTQGIKDPVAIQAAMQQTAEDLGPPGRDDTYGFGLIRPAEALKGLGLGR